MAKKQLFFYGEYKTGVGNLYRVARQNKLCKVWRAVLIFLQ